MPRILGLGVELLRVAALGIASVTPPVIRSNKLAENHERFLTEVSLDLLIQE